MTELSVVEMLHSSATENIASKVCTRERRDRDREAASRCHYYAWLRVPTMRNGRTLVDSERNWPDLTGSFNFSQRLYLLEKRPDTVRPSRSE
jgi:hypothetical protein